MDHVYCCQMKEFTDQVESVHEVAPNTGQHWADGGQCWCRPDSRLEQVPGVPNQVRVYIHKPYQPKWGS